MIYVYLVRRLMSNDLRCSDLIGKVGKGTGHRIDDYNTPYGTQNLEKLKWGCPSDIVALQLEKVILDILEMRDWLLPHKASGKRAEVVAFKFKAKSSHGMMEEYRNNMQWIETLIQYYHARINTTSWPQIIAMITSAHSLIDHGTMDPIHEEHLKDILLGCGYRGLDANLRVMMQRPMHLKPHIHNGSRILVLEDKHSICTIM